MSHGILTQFLTAAAEDMAEGTLNIMQPAWAQASRASAERRTQDQHARSLAGTAITRWAQMGLRYCGLEPEATTLEKAPTSLTAGMIARQLHATAADRLNHAKHGRAETARALLKTAADAGTLLETALDCGNEPEAKEARAQLAQACATMLTVACQTIREENSLSAINAGQEARHATEAAIDGSSPEGILGSRPGR